MKRVIGIVSGKGGVGKTTCTVNLCAALSDVRRDVIAVDADIKMSSLGLQLGMYDFRKTLNDLLAGNGQIYEAIHIHPSGLKMIPSSLAPVDTNMFNMKHLVRDPFLQENFILIDSPPGIEDSTLEIIRSCTDTIVVTTPETPSIINSIKVITKSMDLGIRPMGMIVNMYDRRDPTHVSPEEIEAVCGIPVIGTVPNDRAVRKSIFIKKPVVQMNPYSAASVEFRRMAAKINGQEYKPERFLPVRRLVHGVLRNER
jgi:septum site-determining protein MinD